MTKYLSAEAGRGMFAQSAGGLWVPMTLDAAGQLPVVQPFTHSIDVTGTFSVGGSYTVGQNIGGLIIVPPPGLVAGTRCRFNKISFNIPMAALVTDAASQVTVFNAAPSATIADGVVPTYTAADAAKARGAATLNRAVTNGTMGLFQGSVAGDVALDILAQSYLVWNAGGTNTWTTPGVGTWWANLLY